MLIHLVAGLILGLLKVVLLVGFVCLLRPGFVGLVGAGNVCLLICLGLYVSETLLFCIYG